MEKENENNMNLLEKGRHVITCNVQDIDFMHVNHVNTEQNPLENFDSSKEALLRLMSTTNDPEEDIYTATAAEDLSEVDADEVIRTDKLSGQIKQCEEASEIQCKGMDTGESIDPSSATISNNNVSTKNVTETKRISHELTDIVNLTTLAGGSSGDKCDVPEQDIPDTLCEQNNDKESEKGFLQGSQKFIKFVTSNSEVSSDDSEMQKRTSSSPNVDHCHVEDVIDGNSETSLSVESQSPTSEKACVIEAFASVSEKLDILKYAKSEWKGTTHKAECLRQGYEKIIEEANCKFMRKIRGDNYCAFRAAAFQILTQNVKILSSYPDWQTHILNLPERLTQHHDCSWLRQWTFADRLPSDAGNRILIMQECLTYFIDQKQFSESMENIIDRQAYFLTLFNSGSIHEIKIFEAIKLMMLETAVSLYDANLNGDDVPVFAWLLFARDTSENPYNLMINHLNPAGKTGGLEQVEMCLLGQALEVTVQVFRPSNVEEEDFITHYPDHMLTSWDKIKLIAEDDRHYNIVITES